MIFMARLRLLIIFFNFFVLLVELTHPSTDFVRVHPSKKIIFLSTHSETAYEKSALSVDSGDLFSTEITHSSTLAIDYSVLPVVLFEEQFFVFSPFIPDVFTDFIERPPLAA